MKISHTGCLLHMAFSFILYIHRLSEHMHSLVNNILRCHKHFILRCLKGSMELRRLIVRVMPVQILSQPGRRVYTTLVYPLCLTLTFFFFSIFHSIRSVLPQSLTVQQQKKRLVRRVLGGKLQLQAGDARQTARQPEEMHG